MSDQPITLGVISDTHMPQRLRRLPDAVFSALHGVDMVLHAGDVGTLSVLDALSAIAPVVAVHGNDDTPEATDALPYLQVITVAGQRVLLTHGHFTDPMMETAQRLDDHWETTFERWTAVAREHGASMIVYGHSHIPTATRQGGVWLVNGGAVASPNIATRQKVKTVARVTLYPNQPPHIRHIDLAAPDATHHPPDDFDAGFASFYARYTATIFAPDLLAQRSWILEELYAAAGEEIFDPLLPLAHACWEGEREFISAQEASVLWAAHPNLPREVYEKLKIHPTFGKYL